MGFFRKLSLCSAVTLLLWSCGDESGNGGGGGNGSPPNRIEANISDGEAAGAVSGEAASSQPNFHFGQVANGELIVYLASSDSSVVFFKIDTSLVQLPGSAPVTRTLDDASYLTYTSGSTAQIYEGNRGSLRVNVCPNIMGTVVTGSFEGVGLTNVATELSGGLLEGTFSVAIAASDMSANCSTSSQPVPDAGGDTGESSAPSPGASCPNPTCDGPCCPYLPALYTCTTNCMMTADCGMMGNPMNCMACYAGCPDESGMTADPVCMAAANALSDCMDRHDCDGDFLDEDPCVANNCCDEYRATF